MSWVTSAPSTLPPALSSSQLPRHFSSPQPQLQPSASLTGASRMIWARGAAGVPRHGEPPRAEHPPCRGHSSGAPSREERASPRDSPSSPPSGHHFGSSPLQMLGSGPFGPRSWLLSPGWVAVPPGRWQRQDGPCSPRMLPAHDLGVSITGHLGPRCHKRARPRRCPPVPTPHLLSTISPQKAGGWGGGRWWQSQILASLN